MTPGGAVSPISASGVPLTAHRSGRFHAGQGSACGSRQPLDIGGAYGGRGAEPGAGHPRAAAHADSLEPDVLQDGAAQIGAVELCIVKIRAREIRIAQVRNPQLRGGEIGTHPMRPQGRSLGDPRKGC